MPRMALFEGTLMMLLVRFLRFQVADVGLVLSLRWDLSRLQKLVKLEAVIPSDCNINGTCDGREGSTSNLLVGLLGFFNDRSRSCAPISGLLLSTRYWYCKWCISLAGLTDKGNTNPGIPRTQLRPRYTQVPDILPVKRFRKDLFCETSPTQA